MYSRIFIEGPPSKYKDNLTILLTNFLFRTRGWCYDTFAPDVGETPSNKDIDRETQNLKKFRIPTKAVIKDGYLFIAARASLSMYQQRNIVLTQDSHRISALRLLLIPQGPAKYKELSTKYTAVATYSGMLGASYEEIAIEEGAVRPSLKLVKDIVDSMKS